MPTTITINFDTFPKNITAAQIKMMIYESKCWRCGDDINGRQLGHYEPDYWTCNGTECCQHYCDECVRTVGGDADRDFYCVECAEKEADYQKCDRCPAYRSHDDETCWGVHVYKEGDEHVLCPDCEEKMTPEEIKHCAAECGDCNNCDKKAGLMKEADEETTHEE